MSPAPTPSSPSPVIDPRPSGHDDDEVHTITCHPPEITTTDLRRATGLERERAWRRFYAAHFSAVYRMVCRAGAPSAEVEDLCQKVFLVVHRRLPEHEHVDNVRGWLRGIVLRVVADHRRWAKVRQVKHWLVRSTAGASAVPRRPDLDREAREALDLYVAILDRMSSKLRDVLVMTELEELRPQEAAEVLGIPVNTVRSRQRLARQEFARWRAHIRPGIASPASRKGQDDG